MAKYRITYRIEDETYSDRGKRVDNQEYFTEASTVEEASDFTDTLSKAIYPNFWLTEEVK